MLVEGMVQIVCQTWCILRAFPMQVSQEQILERAGRLDDSRALGFIDETEILVTRINI